MLSPRFTEAVAYAIDAHGSQTRKGGDVPYVAHLLAVASLVLEAGGDEEMAIAGLLHDTIEDTDTTAADIAGAFGGRVAAIVEACTETDEKPKPPWRPRKERYIANLAAPRTPTEVLVVSLADKLHNARSMLADYRHLGEEVAGWFSAGPQEQLWYYQTLAGIFSARLPGAMTNEFRRTVDELRIELDRLGPVRPLP